MGLLASGDRHGYDLKREHDTVFSGAKPLAFGQVYDTLDRLQRKGFVVAVEVERVDGPDRTVFALTDVGREELDSWLGGVEAPAPHVANPLAVKATIALLVGSEAQALRYLADQRAAHLERMRYYTKLKTDPAASLTEILAADYAIAHLDADLTWLDLALDRITQLSASVASASSRSAVSDQTSEPATSALESELSS